MTIRTKRVGQIVKIQTHLPNFNITIKGEKIEDDRKNHLQGLKFKKIIQDPKELMDLSNKLEAINMEITNDSDNPFTKQTFIYPTTISSIAVVIAIILAIILAIKTWKERNPF